MMDQIIIFFQIVFIDLVLAGDNAIIIGMVASQFPIDQRKKIIFWGIAAAVILRIVFTLITACVRCSWCSKRPLFFINFWFNAFYCFNGNSSDFNFWLDKKI